MLVFGSDLVLTSLCIHYFIMLTRTMVFVLNGLADLYHALKSNQVVNFGHSYLPIGESG